MSENLNNNYEGLNLKQRRELTDLSVDYLIDYNKSLGYDESDAICVTYDDLKEMTRGKELPLYKYAIIEYGFPATIGHYLLSQLKQRDKENPGYLPASIKKNSSKKRKTIVSNTILYIVLTIVAAVVFFPILMVVMNSFKTNNGIGLNSFLLPNAETFNGVKNYTRGFEEAKFWNSFGYSLFITVFSTVFILLFTSMTAWFLTRVKTWWTKLIYYLILFSMIIPFQMVMLPMNQIASTLKLNNMFGIVLIYIGFGAGLSTFMYAGFVKSVPVEIEEAAMIDGCNPVQTFFKIVFPVLKPTTVTIAVLNVMWIWNDYLLPNMVLGSTPGKTTLPVAIQMVTQGSYGSTDYGMLMAMIVLTIIPVVVFYLFGQKYIIKGVTAGAVKG